MLDVPSVELVHVALCANKSSHCVDVGPGDLISFGSSHSVVLYRPCSWFPHNQQFVSTFNHHKQNVICTRWIRHSTKKTCLLLSGSMDGKITCWRLTDCDTPAIDPLADLNEHDGSVTCLDGIVVEVGNLVVSTSADSSVKVWLADCDFGRVNCIQKIDLVNGFAHAVSLHVLPKCDLPVLACALDDFTVSLYLFEHLKSEIPGGCQHVVKLRGHEDWVRDVDFINAEADVVYLASSSQDSFIRLWKISCGDDGRVDDLDLKQETFTTQTSEGESCNFTVTIDAVLCGHENWVYSVSWRKNNTDDLQLVSSSIDKTVVIWNHDKNENVWVDKIRVGEIGGNTLGFHGALFSADGQHVIAHSYSGALHGWDKVCGTWLPAVMIGGHSSVVNDIAWDPKLGRYLASTGEDQTTRLFGFCAKSWHEVARPQIHGYDMHCLALISSLKFVSGADEKVMRVFEASKNFIENMRTLTGHTIVTDNCEAAEGATVPALGLSNKAVTIKEKDFSSDRSEQYIENLFIPSMLHQPPPETYLLQNTLWPESRKVYGHVYEIFSLTCNHAGTLVTSAAKSSQAKHSDIIVWDVMSWTRLCSLTGHSLTVTQMEFSPNDRHFLSVSRDRTWILRRVDDVDFHVVARSDKQSGHTRVIWSCSWSHDSRYFATASRDKRVALWKVEDDIVERVAVVSCDAAATAVAFAPQASMMESHVLAIGHESGKIKIMSFGGGHEMKDLMTFNSNLSHCLHVKRLRWRPRANESDEQSTVLASCGFDHQIKIFQCNFNHVPLK